MKYCSTLIHHQAHVFKIFPKGLFLLAHPVGHSGGHALLSQPLG